MSLEYSQEYEVIGIRNSMIKKFLIKWWFCNTKLNKFSNKLFDLEVTLTNKGGGKFKQPSHPIEIIRR